MIKQLPKYVIRLKFMKETNMPDPVKTLSPIFGQCPQFILPKNARKTKVFSGFQGM